MSLLVFECEVPVLGDDAVTYEREFSEADGWIINCRSSHEVWLARKGDPTQNVRAIPCFAVNGYAYAVKLAPAEEPKPIAKAKAKKEPTTGTRPKL